MIGFLSLYKFTNYKDKILIIVGIMLGIISGCTSPVFIILWGKEIDLFANNYHRISMVVAELESFMWSFIALGAFSFCVSSALFSVWRIVSESIMEKCRTKYMESFIKKDIVWMEQHNLIELATKFRENCLSVQKSIGDKIALFTSMLSMLVSCVITAFFIRWTFSLFLLSLLPILLSVLAFFLNSLMKRKESEVELYKDADTKAA